MKNIFLLVLFASMTGCGYEERTRYRERVVCENEVKNDVSSFILQCIKNGNPKSDEEPEDWIWRCEDMAQNLYCSTELEPVIQYRTGFGGIWLDGKLEGNND